MWRTKLSQAARKTHVETAVTPKAAEGIEIMLRLGSAIIHVFGGGDPVIEKPREKPTRTRRRKNANE